MSMPTPASFGALLRTHRMARKLTQIALGARANCSRETIRDLESGQRAPFLATAKSLADALDLTEAARATFLQMAQVERPSPGHPPLLALPPYLAQPPHLIGRDQEVAAVCATLQRPEVRLLTLIGPPGIGKTCLAVAVARHLQATFAAGASFSSLMPTRDPAGVLPAIAQALGVAEAAEPSQLIRRLQVFCERESHAPLGAVDETPQGREVSCGALPLWGTVRVSRE